MTPEKKPNNRLRRELDLRGWRNKRLADELKTTPENISRWVRGERPPSKYYQEAMCILFNKTAEELGFMEPEEGKGGTMTVLTVNADSSSLPPHADPPNPLPNSNSGITMQRTGERVILSVAVQASSFQALVQQFQTERVFSSIVEASPYLVEASSQREGSSPSPTVKNEDIIEEDPDIEKISGLKGEPTFRRRVDGKKELK